MVTPPPDSYQIGLLDGGLHDNRTAKQRRLARSQSAPKQLPMFDNQTAFGQGLTRMSAGTPINGKGQPCSMALMTQDPRSESEIEYAALDDCDQMFDDNQLVSKGDCE